MRQPYPLPDPAVATVENDPVGEVERFTNGGATPFPQAPAARSPNILGALFTGAATATAGLFTTLVVLFYLLVSGETFLRRLVEILPRFDNKRQAVEISLHIERNISINLLALVFWFWMWGVPGAILAVPMLAIPKIVCDDLGPPRALGHFLEG